MTFTPGSIARSQGPWTSINGVDTSDVGRMVTPERTRIFVSAGPWSAQQIYVKLKGNGLNDAIGRTLTVWVQDDHPPTRVTSFVDGGASLRMALWLDAWPGTAFSAMPDQTIAHGLGRVWSSYYLSATQRGDWTAYLRARGLAGDPRLDSSIAWRREEIIADDYRLLFGSLEAIEQAPSHLNRELADPRTIPGLRDFLVHSFAGAP